MSHEMFRASFIDYVKKVVTVFLAWSMHGISSFSWQDLFFSMAGSLIFHGGNLELGSLIKGIGNINLGPSYTTMSPASLEGGRTR